MPGHRGGDMGRRLRGIVALNFSPRNLTQVTSAMIPVQDSIVGFASVKRFFFFNNSSRRVILKIELELNRDNLNSILSRSAVTPVFPVLLGSYKAAKSFG